ncbi:hypothetical protein MB27_42260 [Actinoplanes utahensis]|uniref:Transglutaminase-like domain-containing protein n=2 Tax=Actinoplanes utahensis TaxID=1869 RepID=A0A0A6U9J7_ACTUT|nr:hypothetical protein MB27_42260 [Actinoplanes utahensis]
MLVEKLRRIPDAARQFIVTPDETWQLFRLAPALLAELRHHGLPTRGTGESLRYDLTDLRNVAMRMGGSARAARRFWAAGMNRRSDEGSASYEIQYKVGCPSPGHSGDCRYAFLLPDQQILQREVSAGDPAPAPATRVVLRPDWPALPDDARELMDSLSDIEFMRLPASLREDTDFIRQVRLGDCLGTTRYLVAEGRRRGLPIRSRYGVMVVLPYSNRHNWAEISVDGRWVPIDPVMLRWMIEWGVVESPAWDAYRSPGAILVGITETKVPLATHNGDEIVLGLATRRIRESPEASGTTAATGPDGH